MSKDNLKRELDKTQNTSQNVTTLEKIFAYSIAILAVSFPILSTFISLLFISTAVFLIFSTIENPIIASFASAISILAIRFVMKKLSEKLGANSDGDDEEASFAILALSGIATNSAGYYILSVASQELGGLLGLATLVLARLLLLIIGFYMVASAFIGINWIVNKLRGENKEKKD